jgi:hypothetical protein
LFVFSLGEIVVMRTSQDVIDALVKARQPGASAGVKAAATRFLNKYLAGQANPQGSERAIKAHVTRRMK